MCSLESSVATYRTNSAMRRLLSAIIAANDPPKRDTTKLSGSVVSNAFSTLDTVDFDLCTTCDLSGLNLRLISSHVGLGALYYRLKVEDEEMEAILVQKYQGVMGKVHHDFLASQTILHEITSDHKGDHNGLFVAADTIRKCIENGFWPTGAQSSTTGAAASVTVGGVDLYTLLSRWTEHRLERGRDAWQLHNSIRDVLVPYLIETKFTFDFDFAMQIHLPYSELNNVELDAKEWESRSCLWPSQQQKDEIRRCGLLLSAKVDKLGMGDTSVDFQLALNFEPLLQDSDVYRHVMVVMKDVLRVTLRERGFKMPKAFHVKMAMLWVKQEQYPTTINPSPGVFFMSTLEKLIQSFRKGYLANFFDVRVNLLLDMDPCTLRCISEQLEMLSNSPLPIIQSCHERQMSISSRIKEGIVHFLGHIIDQRAPEDFSTVLALETVRRATQLLDYSNHAPENQVERYNPILDTTRNCPLILFTQSVLNGTLRKVLEHRKDSNGSTEGLLVQFSLMLASEIGLPLLLQVINTTVREDQQGNPDNKDHLASTLGHVLKLGFGLASRRKLFDVQKRD